MILMSDGIIVRVIECHMTTCIYIYIFTFVFWYFALIDNLHLNWTGKVILQHFIRFFFGGGGGRVGDGSWQNASLVHIPCTFVYCPVNICLILLQNKRNWEILNFIPALSLGQDNVLYIKYLSWDNLLLKVCLKLLIF